MSLISKLICGKTIPESRREFMIDAGQDIMAYLGFRLLGTGEAFATPVDALTMSDIRKDMAKGAPYEILKDSEGMVFITYDEEGKWKEKYFEEVFQEGETEKKPVLVLFYDVDRDGAAYNLRGSIIFKELSKRYKERIKFVAVDLPWKDIDSEYHKMTLEAESHHGRGLGILSTPEGKRKKQLPPVKGAPCTVMYSPWEILEGETPDNNDRNIKLLDVSLGAPYSDEEILVWLYSGDKAINNWVKYNLFNNPGYTYRENNMATSFNMIRLDDKEAK
jgi:hypothetical protein